MTVSTTPYYKWSNRTDSQSPPFTVCSPSLVLLRDYYRRRWGSVNLGCHNERPIRGGGTMSSHAWGAATDDRFPNRQTTIDAMGWTIAYSAELGVNTIHDYQTQRMWTPINGWQSADVGSVGGTWIHVETTPAAWGDRTPIEDRIAGGIDEVPPDVVLTPGEIDKIATAIASKVWSP